MFEVEELATLAIVVVVLFTVTDEVVGAEAEEDNEADADEDDDDDDEEEDDEDDVAVSLLDGDLLLLAINSGSTLAFEAAVESDESSCLSSSKAARPMLSLVITLLSISSDPSAVAIAIWLNSIK